MVTNDTVAERIKDARVEKGLSADELARHLEVSVKTVYRWESGESEPRSATLNRAALILGVRSKWLRTGNGDRHLSYTEKGAIEEVVYQSVTEGLEGYRVGNSLAKSEQALASSLVPSRVEEYERQLQTIRDMLDDVIREGIHYERTEGNGKRLLPQGARKLLSVLGFALVPDAVQFDKVNGGYVVIVHGTLKGGKESDGFAWSTGVCSTSELDPAEDADLMAIASTICLRRATDRLMINLLLEGTPAGEVFES